MHTCSANSVQLDSQLHHSPQTCLHILHLHWSTNGVFYDRQTDRQTAMRIHKCV